jgi:hypothetical protein
LKRHQIPDAHDPSGQARGPAFRKTAARFFLR